MGSLTWTCTDPTCRRTHAPEAAYCPICCEPRPAEVTREIIINAHTTVMESTHDPTPAELRAFHPVPARGPR